MADLIHKPKWYYESRDERHAAWVKANWQRWKNKGSYLEGYRVDMDEVRAARLDYLMEVYDFQDGLQLADAEPVPHCRAIVPYREPVAVKPPLVTPEVIYLPPPLVVSLWHAAMAA